MNLANTVPASIPLPKLPQGAAASTERHEIRINITRKAFDGLARQGMLFQQGVNELCDNALAAALPGEKARICVALAPDDDKNYLHMAVADWGRGMDLDALQNALQLGSLPTGTARLNEHGYGLNNALACLTGGSGDWRVYTRSGPGGYLKACGPFDLRMAVETVAALDLQAGLDLQWPEPSTVVCARVLMTIARTLQRQGNRRLSDLVTLRGWLAEHLGVAYRGYLELDSKTLEPSAKIAVTAAGTGMLVPPVPVPMMMTRTEHLQVELGGQSVTLTYVYGVLDRSLRDHLVQGGKSRYYYQGNRSTQGIDIRLSKRVIATAQLDEIWCREDGTPLSRHNSYNDFVGELILPELPRGLLATLNNKTGIDRNDPEWDKVFEALAPYPPTKNASSAGEKELRLAWMKLLKAANPEDDVTGEVTVWPTGTRIDVIGRDKSGKCDIYEIKAGKGESLDLYQLRMYWDGLVLSGVQPTRGVLLAAGFAEHMASILPLLNALPTPLFPDGTPSAPYNFSLATHAEKQLV
ncbi:MAG TPA: ATP-binding protein [Candidatus Fournierella merdigallinarum]|nr:ATP-binding protein [Candidatus Fournierella merdigallinarum]